MPRAGSRVTGGDSLYDDFFRVGRLLGEHHLAENLENEWDGEEAGCTPPRAFLRGRLECPDTAAVSPA
jgi:hypothetical protein